MKPFDKITNVESEKIQEGSEKGAGGASSVDVGQSGEPERESRWARIHKSSKPQGGDAGLAEGDLHGTQTHGDGYVGRNPTGFSRGRMSIQNQTTAIEHFIHDKVNGEAWQRILFEAPAYAMERIAISMYYSVFGKQMTKEEKEAYRALREEIEGTLEREDLEYLIKVMPDKQKAHYKSLLSLLPQEGVQQQPQQPMQGTTSQTQQQTVA